MNVSLGSWKEEGIVPAEAQIHVQPLCCGHRLLHLQKKPKLKQNKDRDPPAPIVASQQGRGGVWPQVLWRQEQAYEPGETPGIVFLPVSGSWSSLNPWVHMRQDLGPGYLCVPRTQSDRYLGVPCLVGLSERKNCNRQKVYPELCENKDQSSPH